MAEGTTTADHDLPEDMTNDGRFGNRNTGLPELSVSKGLSEVLVAPTVATASESVNTDESPDLQTRLIYAHVGGQPGFIPRGILEDLVTEDAVFDILNGVLPSQSTNADTQERGYTRKICSITGHARCTYRRVFAILVLIDKPEEILSFISNGIDDSCLPLEGIPRLPEGRQSVFLCLKSTPGTPIPFLKQWSASACKNFYREQWGMIAPCFEKPGEGDVRVKFYDLHDNTILPWTWEDDNPRRGGFSKVKHVRIHEQHHEFGDYPVRLKGRFLLLLYVILANYLCSQLGDGSFAVKCLEGTTSEADFRAEVATLERFTSEGRPGREPTREHLVSLLATFKKGGYYYLLFHWASSDLYGFWNTQNTLSDANVTWLLEQCCGIALGVHYIHEYQSSFGSDGKTINTPNADRRYGRHTDIKPQNLLVFQKRDDLGDYGTIQLTDFGLCEFRGEHSRSNIPQAALSGGTATYSPPEACVAHGIISRSYDIWSLGCVYLEFITWYLGGCQYVKAFIDERLSPALNGMDTDHFCCFEQPETPGGALRPRVKGQVLNVSCRSGRTRLHYRYVASAELKLITHSG
jgi:hypothetical protein